MNLSVVMDLNPAAINSVMSEDIKHIEKSIFVNLQLQNICKLLNAELNTYVCSDHTGKHWNKVELIYSDEEPNATIIK
jgi:hypothetical protein